MAKHRDAPKKCSMRGGAGKIKSSTGDGQRDKPDTSAQEITCPGCAGSGTQP